MMKTRIPGLLGHSAYGAYMIISPFFIYYSSVDCMYIIINYIVTDYDCVIASDGWETIHMYVQSVMMNYALLHWLAT